MTQGNLKLTLESEKQPGHQVIYNRLSDRAQITGDPCVLMVSAVIKKGILPANGTLVNDISVVFLVGLALIHKEMKLFQNARL
jgi:hypothetical protein